MCDRNHRCVIYIQTILGFAQLKTSLDAFENPFESITPNPIQKLIPFNFFNAKSMTGNPMMPVEIFKPQIEMGVIFRNSSPINLYQLSVHLRV